MSRSVYDLNQFGVQIIESVIFLLHFCIRDPNQGIENYKHFWLETISLIHLALLHLAFSATPNVITPNVISSEYSMRLELHNVYDQDFWRSDN